MVLVDVVVLMDCCGAGAWSWCWWMIVVLVDGHDAGGGSDCAFCAGVVVDGKSRRGVRAGGVGLMTRSTSEVVDSLGGTQKPFIRNALLT